MKKLVPNFTFNMSFRSIKLTKFFSSKAKPRKEVLDTTNCVYKFTCPCSKSSYIGMSERKAITRITEHFVPKGDGIYHHIIHCNTFKTKERSFLKNSNKAPLNKEKRDELKFEYFKSKFKILQKNFSSFFKRRNSESYFIRAEEPDLNDQRDHSFLKLF